MSPRSLWHFLSLEEHQKGTGTRNMEREQHREAYPPGERTWVVDRVS